MGLNKIAGSGLCQLSMPRRVWQRWLGNGNDVAGHRRTLSVCVCVRKCCSCHSSIKYNLYLVSYVEGYQVRSSTLRRLSQLVFVTYCCCCNGKNGVYRAIVKYISLAWIFNRNFSCFKNNWITVALQNEKHKENNSISVAYFRKTKKKKKKGVI